MKKQEIKEEEEEKVDELEMEKMEATEEDVEAQKESSPSLGQPLI